MGMYVYACCILVNRITGRTLATSCEQTRTLYTCLCVKQDTWLHRDRKQSENKTLYNNIVKQTDKQHSKTERQTT